MKHAQVSTAKLTKQNKVSEAEDQLNKIKREAKIRGKKHKKEWTKSPRNVGLCEETNLRLIGVPECDEEN